ncbi:MAG TPA: alpha/beta hydrolase [Alphaproteobacteria bacterium]|jgi:pimeloyl-ACP methyl ester carboxylesterase
MAGTASRPGVMFLGGFMSDMTGTKATWLEGFAASAGLPYLRFDYSGHGTSGGAFEDGTIGGWLGDALDVLDRLTEGPQVLVGSSMGGWLALLAARERPARIRGVVGVAAAPDFTEEIVPSELTAAERETLMREGVVRKESPYGDAPYAFTRRLIEEGRAHLILRGPVAVDCPVRLLHGTADTDVAWETALALMRRIAAADVAVTLIKDGDHRLSRPADLARIGNAVMEVVGAGGRR